MVYLNQSKYCVKRQEKKQREREKKQNKKFKNQTKGKKNAKKGKKYKKKAKTSLNVGFSSHLSSQQYL